MPTEKAAIVEVLQSLDQKNDALWTDDGSPLVSEVQRLANDKTITRAQINDALPGFARKSSESIAEPADDGKDDFGDPVADEAAKMEVIKERVRAINTRPEPDPEAAAAEDDGSPEAEYNRLRLIAHGRVEQAEVAVAEAKAAISAAQRELVNAEGRLTRAIMLYSSKYPPISVAANIKQHLARQQEILRERVTGSRFEPNSAANPIDTTMMDRKRNNGRNGQGPRGQTPPPFLPRKAALNY